MPVEYITLLTFVPAAIALNLTPGADMMFCVGQGMRGGTRAAVFASAGISLGSLIHALIAGLGLGAIVNGFPVLFDVIRWCGIAYLLWLALQAIRNGSQLSEGGDLRPSHAFRQGLFVNLSNPKIILFSLAFIPQFVNPAHAVLPQFVVFGAIFATTGLFVNGTFGAFAGGMNRVLTGNPGILRGLDYLSAGIFSLLAARLVFLEKN